MQEAAAIPVDEASWEARNQSIHNLLRAVMNLIRGVLVLLAVYVFVINRQSMTDPTGLIHGVLSLAVLFLVLPRSQGWKLWGLYILGLVGFDQLKNLADETGSPIQFHYPITFDHILFHGAEANVWLQQHLHQPDHVQWFEIALVGVYLSFFVLPHILAIVFARLDIMLFRSYVIGLLATWYIGLIGYFLVPTAPPWMTSVKGYMPPIDHVVPQVIDHFSNGTYQRGYTVIGPNDVAAMPSLHTAITCIVALALWRRGWVTGVLGTVYFLAMEFALLYLGEHYIIDELAGVMVGAFCWFVVMPRLERLTMPETISRQLAAPRAWLAAPLARLKRS